MMKMTFDADPVSSNNRFRERRMKMFLSVLDRIAEPSAPLRILDVGGEPYHWLAFRHLLAGRELEITLFNLKEFDVEDHQLRSVVGDATDLSRFRQNEFDIVYSNSVIEHVGGWAEMRLMAEGITRLSKSYFIQTPYFWFPIEPHFRFPCFHWLPEPLRLRLVMSRSLGFYPRASSVDAAMKMIEGSVLLSRTQFQSLFPGAQIVSERFGPLAKSLIAVSLGTNPALPGSSRRGERSFPMQRA